MKQRAALLDQVTQSVAGEVLRHCAEPELDRSYICDAVVVREHDHYRIAAGAESAAELALCERRQRGFCTCGAPLSVSFRRRFCRRCER